MKIKDKNELKGMTELVLDIPEEELEKYKNRAALELNGSFIQLYNIPFNKFTKELLEEELKRTALMEMGPFAKDFIKSETIDDSDDFAFVSDFVVPIESNDNELSAVIYTKPTIKYDYKNLEKPEPFVGLYDDEKELLIDTELKKLQKNNARLNPVDRAFEEGDAISITENDGDKEETNVFFSEQLDERPTLKSNLIGKVVGDTFTYEPFEDTSITVNQVYELDLDEIDDEFASEVSEFDTLEELKNSIVDNEVKRLKDQYDKEEKNNVLLQFINGIEVSDVEDKLINYIDNPEALNESDVSAFMDGFFTGPENVDYNSIEYFNHVLTYIIDEILNDEHIESDSVVDEIIDNWDSDEYDERFKEPLTRLKYSNSKMSEKDLKEAVKSIVKSNQVQDVIFKYSLDSEN